MAIKLGSTNFGSIYLGSTKIGQAYLGSVKVYGPSQPVLPANTIRCKFTSGYTPTMGDSQTLVDASDNVWDIYKSDTYWGGLLSGKDQLEEVIAANTTGVTSMYSMFYGCSYLTSVPLFDTSSVTNMEGMFRYCGNLTSIPLFDTSLVTKMANMFEGCIKLVSVPLLDTSLVTNMNSMFDGCNRLTSVPLFDTSSLTSMGRMFYGCYAVESGALALYQQVSTQANPPTYHGSTFTNCGRDTITGAAELAQIPSNWK